MTVVDIRFTATTIITTPWRSLDLAAEVLEQSSSPHAAHGIVGLPETTGHLQSAKLLWLAVSCHIPGSDAAHLLFAGIVCHLSVRQNFLFMARPWMIWGVLSLYQDFVTRFREVSLCSCESKKM